MFITLFFGCVQFKMHIQGVFIRESLSTVWTGERPLFRVNPWVFLQRHEARESASTNRAAEGFSRVRILVVAIQIGLNEELLIAVRAGERPLASVFIQMTLSFLTSVYGTVHFQPVCTTEAPPAEITDERLLACVYSHVMHQMRVATELLAAQLASEFLTRGSDKCSVFSLVLITGFIAMQSGHQDRESDWLDRRENKSELFSCNSKMQEYKWNKLRRKEKSVCTRALIETQDNNFF